MTDKDSEAPAAGSAVPAMTTAEQMVALLQVVVDSMGRFEYLEAQRAQALKEELEAEAAKAEERKKERRRVERLQLAALALQGLCSSTDESGSPFSSPNQIAATALEYADALIAALGASGASPPKAAP